LYHHKKAAVKDKTKTGFASEAEVNSDTNVNFYYSDKKKSVLTFKLYTLFGIKTAFIL